MSESSSSGGRPGVFKILIASDIHLGYNEKHPIRGDDSFRSFEEVLQAAQHHDVDFLLLAGDLFHANRPTTATLRRAMSLIRRYCFGGDGTPRFEMKNFKQSNYLDPNLRVKYPIFTIHGNHDDPIGMERVCCLDLLATSGLINYFGKQDHVEQLHLQPIILEKDFTKLMIFGFGSMREERLNHLIQTERFQYLTPDFSDNAEEQNEELRKYFKILLVHQNRVPRPNIKHLNPYDLSDLPDLVIWGHEHQAIKQPELFEQNKFFILQPGSTVATSLCEAEHGDKYYYLLSCYYDSAKGKPRFKIEPHRCETVRPFMISTIDADVILRSGTFKSVLEQQQYFYSFCKNEAQRLVRDGRDQQNGHDKPLVRLRIEYTDKDQMFDRHQLETELNESVANTDDIIRFIKKRNTGDGNIYENDDLNYKFIEMIDSFDFEVALNKFHVKSVLEQHFASATERQKLSLYDETFLSDKLVEFIDKNQPDQVFRDLLENTKQAFRTILLANVDLTEDLREQIRTIKRRMEDEPEYRKKFQWLTQEPFVKRSAQQLKQKLLGVVDVSSKSDTTSGTEKNDPDDDFYKDDIDMFTPSSGGKAKSTKKTDDDLETKPQKAKKQPARKSQKDTNHIDLDEWDSQPFVMDEPAQSTKGKGRGKGRTTTTAVKTRTRATKRDASHLEGDTADDLDNDEMSSSPVVNRKMSDFFPKRKL